MSDALRKYLEADARLCLELYRRIATLPPPTPEWLAANPQRWSRDRFGNITVYK